MFYNAAMQFDRDLNVAVVRALFPAAPRPRRGWEMLAATGVRGLRLVEETGVFSEYDFTETNPAAVEVLSRNLQESGHSGLKSYPRDAREPLAEAKYDYVDLDPFGTPAPYVDSALRALAPGGTLAVTATDMPVLTGVARGVCEQRYGGRPIRGAQGPEGGLRILIAFLKREAARRSFDLRPVVSYVHDHYVRTYLARIEPPSGAVPDPGAGDPQQLGDAIPELRGPGPFGPMWLGELFDSSFVSRLEVPASAARPEELRRFLERIREESSADRPFYYEPNSLAATLHLPEPPPLVPLLEALRKRGFRAGRSHVRPSAFRTTAPRAAVYETARAVSSPR